MKNNIPGASFMQAPLISEEETRIFYLSMDENPLNLTPDHQILHNEISQHLERLSHSVFTEYMKVENGQLLKSREQVRLSAELVNLDSNVQIGMFYMVCKEVNAIKPQTSGTDFVKALSAIGILGNLSNREIDRIADGFRLKVNGGKHRGKTVIGLASRHALWKNEKDREFGRMLYGSLRTAR